MDSIGSVESQTRTTGSKSFKIVETSFRKLYNVTKHKLNQEQSKGDTRTEQSLLFNIHREFTALLATSTPTPKTANPGSLSTPIYIDC